VVRNVDFNGIVDHHFLNFLFIIILPIEVRLGYLDDDNCFSIHRITHKKHSKE